jgi:hypothetical protein
MVEGTKVAAVILGTGEMDSRYRRKMQSVFHFFRGYIHVTVRLTFWSIESVSPTVTDRILFLLLSVCHSI